MLNSKDLLARLLANENINVIRANVETASFDSMSRTMTLPQWKDMTTDVEDMLIGHEVGHALYTTLDYIDEPDFRKLHGYMNIIEDVRIEKKVKAKYPGLRKAFVTAYKSLQEKDFFGIADKDLSKLLLIDKINLYYKCGYNCGVKFTQEEMNLVRKVDRCDSMADVYNLAKEIYAFAKHEHEAKQKELDELRKMNGEDADENMEEIESDYMDDEDDFDNSSVGGEEETERETKNKTNESFEQSAEDNQDKELESVTQRNFDNRLGELADTETLVQYFSPKLEMTRNPVISYKTIIPELRSTLPEMYDKYQHYYSAEYVSNLKRTQQQELTKFKTDSSRVVNYLVKEFEMRKSATEYRRITTSKSGDLDTRKLYAHSLTDDIFKKLDIIPEDKNHGMIFLMDWSGSMSHVMRDTIKQVINLAMFCQRIQIPYQVFAFTSNYESVPYDIRQQALQGMDPKFAGFADSQFHLFEFFSNKMTNSEFNSMIELLMTKPWTHNRKYDLNSTPLNESLLFLVDYVGKFIKSNSVEKMSVITLTDGEGHALSSASGSLRSSIYNRDSAKHTKVKNYIRDPLTKKEYPFDCYGADQTRTLLRIIKDRYQVKTVGFHICANSRRDITSFIRNNIAGISSGTNEYMLMEQIRKDIRQNDYALLKNTGRDELYLLSAAKQRIEEGSLEIKEDMNARAIAKQFGKFLNVKKNSRVVLSRFVGLVA